MQTSKQFNFSFQGAEKKSQMLQEVSILGLLQSWPR